MVAHKPRYDCRHSGIWPQPNFFKKVKIGGCAVGWVPLIYIERATEHAIRSLGSAGEHRLHTAGVTGSNPVATTMRQQVIGCFSGGLSFFRHLGRRWGTSEARASKRESTRSKRLPWGFKDRRPRRCRRRDRSASKADRSASPASGVVRLTVMASDWQG